MNQRQPSLLRLGTRSSALARWQADWVAGQLHDAGHTVQLVPISTSGDGHRSPLTQLGETGVFTKALQRSLLRGEIDLAVHSLKDLPTQPVEGVTLAAIPRREDPHDVLVSTAATSLAALAKSARIGTGSPRRKSQLLAARADLNVSDIRGNVDTRLRALDAGEFDALVLAAAGLRRLGLDDRIAELLDFQLMLPAAGQGAVGIEIRRQDQRTLSAVAPLDHSPTNVAVCAERALLRELRAGCLAPVGAHAALNATGQLTLQAVVLATAGDVRITAQATSSVDEAERLAHRVATALLQQGADRLIANARAR